MDSIKYSCLCRSLQVLVRADGVRLDLASSELPTTVAAVVDRQRRTTLSTPARRRRPRVLEAGLPGEIQAQKILAIR